MVMNGQEKCYIAGWGIPWNRTCPIKDIYEVAKAGNIHIRRKGTLHQPARHQQQGHQGAGRTASACPFLFCLARSSLREWQPGLPLRGEIYI